MPLVRVCYSLLTDNDNIIDEAIPSIRRNGSNGC
jgi:hypothetical protein